MVVLDGYTVQFAEVEHGKSAGEFSPGLTVAGIILAIAIIGSSLNPVLEESCSCATSTLTPVPEQTEAVVVKRGWGNINLTRTPQSGSSDGNSQWGEE